MRNFNPGWRVRRFTLAGAFVVGLLFSPLQDLYSQTKVVNRTSKLVPPRGGPELPSGPTCPPKTKILWVTPTDSGDVVEGPVCIAMAVNSLRYSSNIELKTTVQAGENLGAVFKADSGLPAAATIDDAVKEVLTQGFLWVRLERQNNQQLAILNSGLAGLRDLVASSDVMFATSQADGILNALKQGPVRDGLDAAAKASWGTSDDINTNLKATQLTITKLLLANPPPSDADKARLTAAETSLEGLLTSLSASMVNGDKTLTFQKQKRILVWWRNYTTTLTDPSSFVVARYVPCSLFGNQTKSVNATLSRLDLLPTIDGMAATSADLTNAAVTVSCSSPFVVSAGVEFSFLKNNTFGLIPSGTMGTNQFGVTNTATISPIPLGMVHGRLWESADHMVGAYVGFGVGAHVQDAAAGGAAAEYLAGVGIGLFHTIFLTPGWHLGKVAALNGGYKLGDIVPTAVTTVPVKSSYASGFGLAITFTKP